MATHSSFLAWEIPWTGESGGYRRNSHGVAKSQTQLSMDVLFVYFISVGTKSFTEKFLTGHIRVFKTIVINHDK